MSLVVARFCPQNMEVSSNNLAKEEKETEGQAPEDIYPHPSVEKRVRAAKRRKDENGKGSRLKRQISIQISIQILYPETTMIQDRQKAMVYQNRSP